MAQAMGARPASNFDAARVAELDRLAAAVRPSWEHLDGPLAIHPPSMPPPASSGTPVAAGAAPVASAAVPAAPAAPVSVDDAAATNVLPAVTPSEAKISEIEPEELLPTDLVTDPIHPPGVANGAAAQAAAVVAEPPKPAGFPPPASRNVSSAPSPRPVPRAAISSPSISDAYPAMRPSRKPLVIGLLLAGVVGGGLVYAFHSGSSSDTPATPPTATASATPPPKLDIPPVPADTGSRTETVPAKPVASAAAADTSTSSGVNSTAGAAPTTTPPAAPTHAAVTPPPPPQHAAVTPPATHSAPHHAAPSGGSSGSKPASGGKSSGGIVRDVPF